MPEKRQEQSAPDLGYLTAATVLPGDTARVGITLIGCGGTGGWLAPSLARLARLMIEEGKDVSLMFCDPDTVEEGNLMRQNFCAAEIGLNKAVTLGARLAAAWGLEITAVPERFGAQSHLSHRLRLFNDSLRVIVGCVDNAAGRKRMAASVGPRSWWLDCGNSESAGQVLLGNLTTDREMRQAFLSPQVCVGLPAPHVQASDLLVARPEEMARRATSCAEMAAANAQSLMVNQRVAAEAGDMLLRFLGGRLRRMASYFDLESGSASARYITQEECRRKRA
jgi:PRTRC genetic system ThiF family protein